MVGLNYFPWTVVCLKKERLAPGKEGSSENVCVRAKAQGNNFA